MIENTTQSAECLSHLTAELGIFCDELETNMKANYRKLNDGTHSSSTYHKKDGTAVRAILKRETLKTIKSIYA